MQDWNKTKAVIGYCTSASLHLNGQNNGIRLLLFLE